jgi:hypothetical protein
LSSSTLAIFVSQSQRALLLLLLYCHNQGVDQYAATAAHLQDDKLRVVNADHLLRMLGQHIGAQPI